MLSASALPFSMIVPVMINGDLSDEGNPDGVVSSKVFTANSSPPFSPPITKNGLRVPSWLWPVSYTHLTLPTILLV